MKDVSGTPSGAGIADTRHCAVSSQLCCCFSRVRLFMTPWTGPSGCSVHGILQARILEWVATPSSRGSFQSRIEPACFRSPEAGGFFITSATWEVQLPVELVPKKKKNGAVAEEGEG